ncbi:MAG: sulfotransferase [Caulobacterales bacterium]|nr:sulfotransferase [Caulobacterales bacterium]
MTTPTATPASLGAATAEAAALLATDPAAARRLAEQILRLAPQDPRPQLILASALRRTGEPARALAILQPLARAWPRAALTQYELGLAFAAHGQEVPALAALRQAVGLNRELAEAWRALGDLLFAAGDLGGAEAAFAEHARAAVQDPALKPAANAVFEGRLANAERALRTHLTPRPHDPAALQMLGELLLRQGRPADAEALLARTLDLEPGRDGARFALAEALFRQQKGAEAAAHAERLVALAPSDAAYRNLLAACLGLLGEDAHVLALYEALAADFPRQPRIWLNYGHALRTVGRRADAVAAYKRCIGLAPELGDAYWSLANLKVGALEDADVAAMRRQLERPDLAAPDRLHLQFALGKALEDRGDDADAFAHYAEGAALRRADAGYDPEDTTRLARRSQALLTAGFFTERAGGGDPSDAPIFVVGLPRAGSTLVEQILASHSAVEGTMELPHIGLIARGLDTADAPYPEALAALDPQTRTALGQLYLERALPHRKLGRARFVDKMPNNFQHIGLIQLILPNARIVDVRRHPLGCGFSAFKQHFAQGQAFSYDLSDLGRYYADYVGLMRHLDRALPGRIHRVIYEDLVADTEGEVGRLLAYCGLPFEPACLDFHRNDRAVRTVSSEQVRQPIFRDGVDQWRRFEPWLGPLKAALGETLETWRD